MSINTADFAALAVTIVLFAVIYYLDYKKGVDFGLLTLLGTVFGIAVGLGFGNHFTYVEIFGRIYTNVLTALVVPMLLFSIIASITNLSESIHLKKIGGKSIFYLILNTAIASTITVIAAVILKVGDGFAYKVADGYQKVEVPSVVDTIVNLFPSNFATNWSEGQIIPIVVFAIIIALSYNAISKENESVKPFKAFIDAGNQVIGQAIDWIIGFTPYAVLSFLARAVGRSSVTELLPLLSTLVLSYILCAVQAFGVEGLLIKFVAKLSPVKFFKGIAPAQYVAFTTQSSVGTIPVTLRQLKEALGVDGDVASFTAGLGANVGMPALAPRPAVNDATSPSFTAGLGANVGMPACAGIWPALTAVFSVHMLGYHYGIAQYAFLILITLVVSVGTVGVPGTATITSTAVFAALGLPIELVVVFAPISTIVDMARTMTNVTGAATAAVITAATEGLVDEEVYNSDQAKHVAVNN